MAIEPTAVTPQDNSEIAPTCAMLAGSMMMPDPIMLTATSTVSCIRLIFFPLVVFIAWPLRADGLCLGRHAARLISPRATSLNAAFQLFSSTSPGIRICRVTIANAFFRADGWQLSETLYSRCAGQKSIAHEGNFPT